MTTLSTLNDKDQELIAIGASIAAGCVPCAKYHFRAARIAGAQDAEIQQAVSDALCVRRSATEGMAELADSQLHRDAGAACCDDKLLLGGFIDFSDGDVDFSSLFNSLDLVFIDELVKF